MGSHSLVVAWCFDFEVGNRLVVPRAFHLLPPIRCDSMVAFSKSDAWIGRGQSAAYAHLRFPTCHDRL